ncbi:D-alanyl-lipoteichoic acid biosynthesis protein DltD, partial [Staphylococcus epidermidis]
VHIGWKGWVYVDQQIAKHMNDDKQPKVDHKDKHKHQEDNK